MLGSLTFALLATAAAATPCESLRALATPQAMIATAERSPRRTLRSTRWTRRRPAGRRCRASRPADPAALPRDAGAQADAGLQHQLRALDADRQLERKVPGRRERRLRRIDPGIRRHAGRAAPWLRDRRHRHRPLRGGRPRRHVRARPSGEDRGLRVSRRPRDDGEIEGADQGVLRSIAAVLILQGMLDRRTPGRDGGPAVSRGLRRDHRRRPREPPHPDAHGGLRAPDQSCQKPRPGDPGSQGEDGERRGDEQVRHAQGRLPEQPAPVHVQLLEAAVQRRGWRHLPDQAAAAGRGDLLRRPEEQQGRADLLRVRRSAIRCRPFRAPPTSPSATR